MIPLRLKPYLQVAIPLAAVAVAFDLALARLQNTPVLAWLPHTVTGTGFLEESRGRVAQLEQEYEQGRIDPADRLAAIVGISNLREAVELSVLNDGVGGGWRFLGVGGAGLGMNAVGQYADLVLDGIVRPDAVVLGLGLHQLVDYRERPAAPQGVVDHLRARNLRAAAVTLREETFAYSRREDVSVTVEGAVLDARAHMLAWFGVPLPSLEARERSPWREMVRADWPDHFSDATLAAQEQSYQELGVFDAEAYRHSPDAMSALMRIVHDFNDRGTDVVLVLLPENSRLHRRVPTEALEVLTDALDATFHDGKPVVLDFRTAVDDSGFVDLPHMNRSGRLAFSRQLAVRLRDVLPRDPAARHSRKWE